MSDFKFERGMYWEIAEFDGTQEEALAFIVPKIMEQGFDLSRAASPRVWVNEKFYNTAVWWRYVGINSDGIFDWGDSVYTYGECGSLQFWDVFKTTEQQSSDEVNPIADTPSELEECYARIDSLEGLVAELSNDLRVAKVIERSLRYKSGLFDHVVKLLSSHSTSENTSYMQSGKGIIMDTIKILQDSYDKTATSKFKEVSDMTVVDWKQAVKEGWLFEFYDGTKLTPQFVDELDRVGFLEQSYLFSYKGYHLGNGRHITKRIK